MPTINQAPVLERPQPTGSFVKDALLLAQREAERGEPAKARNVLKTAILQLDNVGDRTERAYWQGKIDETAAYVDSLDAQSDALKVASQLQDATYVRNQKLRPDELQELVADNADTQAAMDAEARGESPTWAYNKRKIGELPAQYSQGVANLAAGVLGPWKWALLIGGALVIVMGAGYAFLSYRTASAVAGK